MTYKSISCEENMKSWEFVLVDEFYVFGKSVVYVKAEENFFYVYIASS